MSILLDALRKSEEQRRLGEVPDIHSPVESERAATGRWHRWALWGAIALVALTAAWFGRQQLSRTGTVPGASPERADVAASPAATPAGTTAVNVVAEPAPGPSGDAADNDSDEAPRTPVEALPVDGGSEVAANAPTARQAAPRKSRVNESFTTFEATPEAVVEQQPAASPKATPPAAQTVEAPVAATGNQAPGEPPPATPRPRETEPISFWELPQSVRDSLPDLRITVLVYAEQPGDRFVLIGGNRRVEKDQLQDGVVLDEIRRDGAVFTYRNYRFLVKG